MFFNLIKQVAKRIANIRFILIKEVPTLMFIDINADRDLFVSDGVRIHLTGCEAALT